MSDLYELYGDTNGPSLKIDQRWRDFKITFPDINAKDLENMHKPTATHYIQTNDGTTHYIHKKRGTLYDYNFITCTWHIP